jgi:hypothetical protein
MFAQQSVVLGLINVAAAKTGSTMLKVVGAILALMVLLTMAALYSVRVTGTMHALQKRPRVATALSWVIVYGVLSLVTWGGFTIVRATFDALTAIQPMR